VASRLGSPAQMKGTNAHWLRFFKAAKVSPMDAGGRGSVGGGAHRRGARGAARRDGRARRELDAREGGGGEGGGGHRGAIEDDRLGAAAESGRDSNDRGVRGRTSPAVPCRCADACVTLGPSRRAQRARLITRRTDAVSTAATARSTNHARSFSLDRHPL
jgi:hypothetical protein